MSESTQQRQSILMQSWYIIQNLGHCIMLTRTLRVQPKTSDLHESVSHSYLYVLMFTSCNVQLQLTVNFVSMLWIDDKVLLTWYSLFGRW